jgi:hypothetical protein
VFARWPLRRKEGWALGRTLAWICCGVFFLTGLTGVGLMSSVPQTVLMLAIVGWFVTSPDLRRHAERYAPFVPAPRGERVAAVARRSIESS